MIDTIGKELLEKQNIRQNLITLKQLIKEDDARMEVLQFHQQYPIIMEFLDEEDPKIRKNAAILLGELKIQDALDKLYQAYCKEDKLFVKSAYLIAMSHLENDKYKGELNKRLQELMAYNPPDNEKKHILEEIKELDKIIRKLEGVTKHRFCGYDQEVDIVLTTNPAYREITAEQVKGPRPLLIPAGVKITTRNIRDVISIRTFREMLFVLDCKSRIEPDAHQIAKELKISNLRTLLEQLHEGEAPFYFRLDIKGRMPLDERGSFIRKLSAAIEQVFDYKLMNSADNYEIEIRLVMNKDGTFCPFLKLFTIPMTRFAYRKNSVAASIQPSTAALLMQLAKPFMENDAQVLDPFCGVGTMLVERDMLVPAGDMYGTDTFAEAITKGRENASTAGRMIHFVNRDFFDFTHSYMFDEVVTNMPVRGRKKKDEQDNFYAEFFGNIDKLMTKEGTIIMYSNEGGFVKKQLRLHKKYRLMKEYCIREKDGFYLFIIRIKG